MYKAVIFDLDDTLYDYSSIHPLAMERLRSFTCRRFCLGESEFESAYTWAKEQVKLALGNTASSHNRILYCQKTLERLGKNPADGAIEMYDCYWNAMLELMELRDGTLELLQSLKSDGIKIALCTDLTAHIQHRKIRTLGLVPYVDVLVTSEEAGAEKPDGRIYELTLRKLGELDGTITAGDCLFVGDDAEKDMEGPMRFGMEAMKLTDVMTLQRLVCRNL